MTINLTPILAAAAVVAAQLPPLLTQLKDTSLPLDERWDAYTQLVEKNLLVREGSNVDGFLSGVFGYNNVSLYDDFNMDRGQSRTFPEIWEAMNNEFFEGGDAYDDLAKRDAWRERVLASGLSGFEYDW